MTKKILSFNEALVLAGNKPKLLLGNGFSIAFNPKIFSYESLLDKMDVSGFEVNIKDIFLKLETRDFEVVISALNECTKILPTYIPNNNSVSRMKKDCNHLKNALANTIAGHHPEYPSALSKTNFLKCRKFLSYFGNKYTLNYDLLLYWVIMHDEVGIDIDKDDGFRDPETLDEDYVTWEVENTNSQNIYYMHGALHIFDAGYEILKYTWSKTNIRLLQQIKTALNSNKFPLVVTEGKWEDKKKKINHNGYLNRCFRSFSSISKSLFTFGLSFSESDGHIIKSIEKGKVSKIFISVFGKADSNENKKMMRRVTLLKNKRAKNHPLEVFYYDAESAHVWT